MSGDLYIKDRLSERRTRRPIMLPIVIAIVLGILATIFAIIFGGPRPEREQEPGSEQKTAEDMAGAAENDGGGVTEDGAAAKDAPTSAEVVQLLREGEQYADADDLAKARANLLGVLELSDNSVAKERARKMLGKINIELLLTPRKMPGKVEYVVQPGDSLEKIARRHGVNIKLIQKSNEIKGALIHPGQRLRIPAGDFGIVVDKSDNILTVTYNDEYFKTYRVGTGKHDKTPTGSSKVTDRIMHPTWWQPDGKAIPYGSPDNLLGTHWLALDIRGYGIHGTWEPETIGKHESEGCIRMRNEDIEELYTIIPIGTPVTIEE